MDYYRCQAFAQGTKKTYQSHLRSYLAFCNEMNILPVPATDQVVAQYAAYLARRLKSSSIRQYLNIIRILHLECQLPNPCEDSWYLKMTLTGIDKVKGTAVKRKEPMKPEQLLFLKSKLNFSSPVDCIFWAACLIMFFWFIEKIESLRH